MVNASSCSLLFDDADEKKDAGQLMRGISAGAGRVCDPSLESSSNPVACLEGDLL
jgi:hypothetical protein